MRFPYQWKCGLQSSGSWHHGRLHSVTTQKTTFHRVNTVLRSKWKDVTCSCTGVGARIEISISWKSGAQKQRISNTITLIDQPATFIHADIYKQQKTRSKLLSRNKCISWLSSSYIQNATLTDLGSLHVPVCHQTCIPFHQLISGEIMTAENIKHIKMPGNCFCYYTHFSK